MHIDVAADAFGVDDDDGALGPPNVGIEDAVGLRHVAMRPEVGAERVRDAAE
jgi:hypothetical protein